MAGDGQQLKFLAIKNWEQYQPQNKKQFPWIRDYKDKDFDPEVSKLTVFQRGVLDMCCRLRGRHGKNLSNDPLWIVGAVSILPQERRNAVSAIGQLIVKGFLVQTNQEHNLLEERRGEERRGENSNCDPSKEGVKDIPITPVILELQPPDEYEEERKKETEIIEKTFEHYCMATERNRLTYTLTPQRKKTGITRLKDCLKLTKGDYDKAAELLRAAIDKLAESNWHMGRDPATNGKKYCDWVSNLFKSYESMERWWNA